MVSEVFEEEEEGEQPTVRETPSGRWIVAVDRGARLIADAIEQLEAGADVEHVIDKLREAHGLVNGRIVP